MSITRELRTWNTGRLRPDHTAALDAIADRIDKEHKRLTDKAHADGEKSAMKQVRSRSVDYRKGYEQAMADVDERTKTEQGGSQTIDILMELLNEYYESECALDEDRVTYYADRLDGRTEDKRVDERTKTEQNGVGSSKVRAGSSITDELREWFKDRLFMGNGYAEITAIADRIDERYAEGVQLAWADGIARAEGDLKAFEATHVKLPVDADGVPIHVGDRMAFEDGEEFDVIGISDSTLFFMVDDFADTAEWTQAGNKHHVQPDSWERIIQDAIAEGFERTDVSVPCEVGNAELVERCKRLAGDAE